MLCIITILETKRFNTYRYTTQIYRYIIILYTKTMFPNFLGQNLEDVDKLF